MSRRLSAGAFVVLVALPWAIAPLVSDAGASHAANQGSSAAAQLVDRMREAAAAYTFTGTVSIVWRDRNDNNKVRRASVDVTAVDGTLEFETGTARVLDDGGDTYVLGDDGWKSVAIAPITATLPSPDHAWRLSTRKGPVLAGRTSTMVEATRDSYGVAQRLFVDTQTGLLLGREVRDADGRMLRSIEFTSLVIGGGPHSLDQPGLPGKEADALRTVPDGYRAPNEPGGGYVLVSKAKAPGGGVQLSYSDGMFLISIFQQKGELDWDGLAQGGTTTEIAGHTARRYVEPGVDVMVWERDDVVYTCVTDAPPEALAVMISGLSPSGRSTVEKAVDFVLGPFGWS